MRRSQTSSRSESVTGLFGSESVTGLSWSESVTGLSCQEPKRLANQGLKRPTRFSQPAPTGRVSRLQLFLMCGDHQEQLLFGLATAQEAEELGQEHQVPDPRQGAQVHAAIAGGTEILQATDIRVAGESARFGISEARWGLFPLGGSTVRLRRQIPYTIAAELLLTGKHVTASEALDLGLIGHVVPDGQAVQKAMEIANEIAANGPIAVQAILRSLRETEGIPEVEGLKRELEIGGPVFATKDAREGPKAFAEKRKPEFEGK